MKIYLRFPRKYLKYHRVWNSGFSRWTGLATGLETWKKKTMHLHEFNKQVKCKFSCIKMVVKLFYNPYQALKRNIIIRTLIKDKHITLPILMLYNFQNKKNKSTLSFEIISTRNCLLRMVCHLIGPIWLQERNLMLESW